MHHAFNVKDQKDQCPYCTKDLSKERWHSHFHSVIMYKSVHCDCGKFVNMPVSFLGSGHDNWDRRESWKEDPRLSFPRHSGKVNNLESRIKIEKVYSMHP